MNPMKDAYDALVNELREMHKKGPLRISYYVERNTEMTKKIFKLVLNMSSITPGVTREIYLINPPYHPSYFPFF